MNQTMKIAGREFFCFEAVDAAGRIAPTGQVPEI